MNADIQAYVSACIIKGEADDVGNSEEGNEQYPIINTIYLSLKSSDRLNELIPLLDHENPHVRTWAACHTLKISRRKAEKTLKSVSRLRGMVGFIAATTLKEWKKGNLDDM